jgi:DNA-binding response OmpR family regulator
MKPTVLIADGDPELRALYHRFISGRGYEVETATDGLDCVAKLRRLAPAAVMLDLELHWGGGDGVLAWLREMAAMAGIPVILTATAGCQVDGSEVIKPPVVQLLLKPFALSALLNSIRSAVATGEAAAGTADQVSAWSELYLG